MGNKPVRQLDSNPPLPVVYAKPAPFDLKTELERLQNTDEANPSRLFCLSHILETTNADACYLLARLYSGLRSYWDINIAMKYLTLAVDHGNKDALFYLGLFYYLGGEESNKNKLLFRDPSSPYPFDLDHSNPIFVKFEPQYEKSFELFTKSAAYLNNASSYHYLALHFEFGASVEINLLLALANYKLASELGGDEDRKIAHVYSKIASDFELKKDMIQAFQNYKMAYEYDNQKNYLNKIAAIHLELDSKIDGDDDLKFFLAEKENIDNGYIHVAMIYEARKNFELGILYCDEQLKVFEKYKIKLTLEELHDIQVLRRRLSNKLPDNPECKITAKIETMEATILDLTKNVAQLTNLLQGQTRSTTVSLS
ncbi:MAG: hypothetical protein Harvfovirus19_24 [Harvfovirus sp.]|uniref:Uncharacterized protein n=1 Tax=Harvfovirus sp. TaxID=2487768 RepID=A0A3G5A6U5_9VIRU|nr:MAG: hypothetical protein Harvfovirus19_24 [Harvfovirus sp.]